MRFCDVCRNMNDKLSTRRKERKNRARKIKEAFELTNKDKDLLKLWETDENIKEFYHSIRAKDKRF